MLSCDWGGEDLQTECREGLSPSTERFDRIFSSMRGTEGALGKKKNVKGGIRKACFFCASYLHMVGSLGLLPV